MSEYSKLKSLIEEIEELINSCVSAESEAFILWKTKVDRFLSKRYGSDSTELEMFRKISFAPIDINSYFTWNKNKGVYSVDLNSVDTQVCKKGLEKTRAILTAYLDEISEEISDKINYNSCNRVAINTMKRQLSKPSYPKKYQVFVSSTYTDLINERNGAFQCLLDNNCIPVGMEQFPASNMGQMDYIKKMLENCDYYILILGGRYGSLDKDGVGFTEKEYDFAVSNGIPVLSFLIKDPGKLPNECCEKDNIKKYDEFRNKVSDSKMVKFYTNVDDLKASIITSIIQCIKDYPAKGWVRAE